MPARKNTKLRGAPADEMQTSDQKFSTSVVTKESLQKRLKAATTHAQLDAIEADATNIGHKPKGLLLTGVAEKRRKLWR
jgi:hypothetical protein